jgi:hypothetical protein
MLDWVDADVTQSERTFDSQAARIAGVISGGSLNFSSAAAAELETQRPSKITRVKVMGSPFRNHRRGLFPKRRIVDADNVLTVMHLVLWIASSKAMECCHCG